MSDLSLPPLSLLPPAAADAPFAWPTPPYAAYPPPQAGDEPEDCEIEGPNGKVTAGRLVQLDPQHQLALVQVPPARGHIKLRFAQFRRLTLSRPLAPLVAPPGDPHAEMLAHRPIVHCRLTWRQGGEEQGSETVGVVEHERGLFLFEPVDGGGAVRRHFVPRSAFERFEVGPRIGELLVEQLAATPQQVSDAVDEQAALRSRKLGDILLGQQILTPEQLLTAIDQQARMPMVRIGEALTALGFIDDAQLADALEQQKGDRSVPLGELLVRRGWVSRHDLQTALARKMGYPIVDVAAFPVESDAVARVPFALARKLPAMPLLLRGGRLIVALEDPTARHAIEELEFVAQCKVVPALALTGTLAGVVERTYQRLGQDTGSGADGAPPSAEFEAADAGALLATLEQQGGDGREDDERQIEQSDNSLVRLINTMIMEAAAQGVSDIHIETYPGREKMRIRFRKDGAMRPYLELPHTYRSAMIARLKIMCDLDISERRKPQDGKINFSRFVTGQRLELRVATIPTTGGLEDAVLRILASARSMPRLADIGLSAENFRRFTAAVQRPYGMVLSVGPTGSGKTTTLHSALAHINTPDRKIWTAEDPIEITQAGLRQVQVNPKIDFTFAKALRAFLRADPDVIMVGEIRDADTARMAIEASLTGHLVMSTLHTNSAPETVTRLLDMDMDPFNFADSLLAVLAQRLVRKLCMQCRTARPASEAEVEELLGDHLRAYPDAAQRPAREAVLADWLARHGRDGTLPHFHSPGCSHCDGSGSKGRLGLHELMVVNRDLRHLIQTSARTEELQKAAMADGMRTLRQDGIDKVLQGLTTIEEVRSISNV